MSAATEQKRPAGRLAKITRGAGFRSILNFRTAGRRTGQDFLKPSHVLLVDPHDQTRAELLEHLRPMVRKVTSTADTGACPCSTSRFSHGV
eukprot:scaffold1954_cov268-Pinguiococcus_pyrenoidosus.AAC.194